MKVSSSSPSSLMQTQQQLWTSFLLNIIDHLYNTITHVQNNKMLSPHVLALNQEHFDWLPKALPARLPLYPCLSCVKCHFWLSVKGSVKQKYIFICEAKKCYKSYECRSHKYIIYLIFWTIWVCLKPNKIST